MKKIIIGLVVIVLFVNIIGCSSENNKNKSSIGGDFSYQINEKYKLDMTSTNTRKIYHYESDPDKSIGSCVQDFGFDDEFILVRQTHPIGAALGDIPESPPSGEEWYWIINIEQEKKYGPYKSIDEFKKAKEELNVSDNIVVRYYDEYRNIN